MKETRVTGNQFLPFLRRGVAGFDQPAFTRDLAYVHKRWRRDEIKLVREAHPKPAFERAFQLGKKIRPRDLDLVADPLHAGMR